MQVSDNILKEEAKIVAAEFVNGNATTGTAPSPAPSSTPGSDIVETEARKLFTVQPKPLGYLAAMKATAAVERAVKVVFSKPAPDVFFRTPTDPNFSALLPFLRHKTANGCDAYVPVLPEFQEGLNLVYRHVVPVVGIVLRTGV